MADDCEKKHLCLCRMKLTSHRRSNYDTKSVGIDFIRNMSLICRQGNDTCVSNNSSSHLCLSLALQALRHAPLHALDLPSFGQPPPVQCQHNNGLVGFLHFQAAQWSPALLGNWMVFQSSKLAIHLQALNSNPCKPTWRLMGLSNYFELG